jgi:LPXTG-motif cell wall-anchored protein
VRTRIAIAFVLALGVFAAGPGAALAQLSDSGQAAQVQYPDLTASAPLAEDPPADDGLPVTGFVALPLLLVGGLMLAVGGVMHVRTRQD